MYDITDEILAQSVENVLDLYKLDEFGLPDAMRDESSGKVLEDLLSGSC